MAYLVNLSRTLYRFPLPILLASIVAALTLLGNHNYSLLSRLPTVSINASLITAFFGSIAIVSVTERLNLSWLHQVVGLGLIVCLIFYKVFLVPLNEMFFNSAFISIGVASIAITGPFLFKQENANQEFLHFNMLLQTRIVIIAFVTTCIFIGVVILILSCQYLFEIIPGTEIYRYIGDIGLVLSLVFAPIYLLASIPDQKHLTNI